MRAPVIDKFWFKLLTKEAVKAVVANEAVLANEALITNEAVVANEALIVNEAVVANDAVRALIAQLAVPNNEPVKLGACILLEAKIDPVTTTSAD